MGLACGADSWGSIPAEDKTGRSMVPASPSISMVPLDGDEDIGEVVRGFLVRQLSRLEECNYLGPEAGPGSDDLTTTTFVQP